MPLTEEDLSKLLDELSSVSFIWRRIGVELGVRTGILEDQKGKENNDALMDMLIFALRNIEFDWEDIASALFKAEKRKVARKIQEKYCPSKQIEGDDGGDPSLKKPKGQSYQYTMNIRPHGGALIINNVKYPNNPRYGSDRDKEALQKALETLGYAVESVDDLPTTVDIIPTIVEHANKDENTDSFICCILAHGKEGAIQGLDGSTVKIADIARALVDSNNPCQNICIKSPKSFSFKLAKEVTYHNHQQLLIAWKMYHLWILLFRLKLLTQPRLLFLVTATFSTDLPLLSKPEQQEIQSQVRHTYKNFAMFSNRITKMKIL